MKPDGGVLTHTKQSVTVRGSLGATVLNWSLNSIYIYS